MDKWKGNEHCRCTQGCNTASDKLHRQNATLLWPTWRSAHADISNIFHFPSVIDINLLTMVQYSKLQSSCQTVHYPQTPYHIRSLPMMRRCLPLFTETYDCRQPSEPGYPKSKVPASYLAEPTYTNCIRLRKSVLRQWLSSVKSRLLGMRIFTKQIMAIIVP